MSAEAANRALNQTDSGNGVDMIKVFNHMGRLKSRMVDMYTHFHKLFSNDKNAAGVFYTLSINEESRLNLIEYQRRVVRKNQDLFGMVDVDIAGIDDAVSKINAMLHSGETPTLEEAVNFAMHIETYAAARYNGSILGHLNSGTPGVFGSFCGTDNEYYDSLRELAAKRGFLGSK